MLYDTKELQQRRSAKLLADEMRGETETCTEDVSNSQPIRKVGISG